MVAEANASVTFVNKMGLGKANEILYWGKKITAEELLTTGFVKWVNRAITFRFED